MYVSPAIASQSAGWRGNLLDFPVVAYNREIPTSGFALLGMTFLIMDYLITPNMYG